MPKRRFSSVWSPGVAIVLLAVGSCADARSTPADWLGNNRYDYSAGRNAAGSAVVVSYRLTLAPGLCRFSAEGYQTDETILCIIKVVPGSGIDIAFKSYGNGAVTDARGNAEYSLGQTLFSMRHANGKTVTSWGSYALPDEKPHRAGIYFDRGPRPAA